MTIAPAILVLLLCAIMAMRLMYNRRRRSSTSSEDIDLEIAKIRSQSFFYFLFLSYLVLPGVSTTIFRMFPCNNVDPESVADGPNQYLIADYSISCSSPRYAFGVVWATVMIFVYPVGKKS
jgi:hypothetical protein